MTLLSISTALFRLLSFVPSVPLLVEWCPLSSAVGRILAQDLSARRTQPPFAASMMDGYALHTQDLQPVETRLKIIGISAAGQRFEGRLSRGEAVRIFTGAPLPEGANTILIQEKVQKEGALITFSHHPKPGDYVRPQGLDFKQGDVLLHAGCRLRPFDLALAAAMDYAELPLIRKPSVALLSTGNELVDPGALRQKDQIVDATRHALEALIQKAGGEVLNLGIVEDKIENLCLQFQKAQDAKVTLLVTVGGASVSAHDLVKDALILQGGELDFWRIAMRPGKPLLHGFLKDSHAHKIQVLGLPGNPVSALLCASLFLIPLIRAYAGDPDPSSLPLQKAILTQALPPNDERQDYLRASLTPGTPYPSVSPFALQDSSMLSILAQSEALIVREPHALAAMKGDLCTILDLRMW